MLSSPNLNSELLVDFSRGVQASYASLLSALNDVTHPKAGEDSLPIALQSLNELIDRWRMAQLLAMPVQDVRSRFPLAQPETQSLLDGLLTLAIYSEPSCTEGWVQFRHRMEQLYAAIEQQQPALPVEV